VGIMGHNSISPLRFSSWGPKVTWGANGVIQGWWGLDKRLKKALGNKKSRGDCWAHQSTSWFCFNPCLLQLASPMRSSMPLLLKIWSCSWKIWEWKRIQSRSNGRQLENEDHQQKEEQDHRRQVEEEKWIWKEKEDWEKGNLAVSV